MAGFLIGFIWFVVIVGGVLGLSAGIQLARTPYRKK